MGAEQDLRVDGGRSRAHAGLGADALYQFAIIFDPAVVHFKQIEVGGALKDLVLNVRAKTRDQGLRDDERRNAESDSRDGYGRDHRDGGLSAPGAQIT